MNQAKERRKRQIKNYQLNEENGLLRGHYLSANGRRLIKNGEMDSTIIPAVASSKQFWFWVALSIITGVIAYLAM